MKTTLTDEQIQARLGMFTGSEIHKLMGTRGMGKTGETYVMEKVAERLTGQRSTPEFTSAATTWGIDHEPEAVKYFEAATDMKIEPCDTLMNEHIAGTPDGIATSGADGTPFLFEIKCPYNSGNHMKNLLLESPADFKTLRPEYFWQMQAYFWLTGLSKGKFCSYDPRFKEEKRMMILNIEFDEMSAKLMRDRITEAKLMFNNIIAKIG